MLDILRQGGMRVGGGGYAKCVQGRCSKKVDYITKVEAFMAAFTSTRTLPRHAPGSP